MDRVYGSNVASSAPAKPSTLEVGFPRATGAGTVPGYWWYHMVTESLRSIVTAAGLTPSSDDMTQLATAIEVIAKKSNVGGSLKPVMYLDVVGVPLNGSQVVDGRTPSNGSRVMRAVNNSTTNGVYVVNYSGAWTRDTDFEVGTVIADGTLIEVNSGDTFANKVFILNADPVVRNITVGTTPFGLIDITTALSGQLSNYLLIADAASTYLTQTSAAATYATKTQISDMLTATVANNTYLKKTDAANTYATISGLNTVASSVTTLRNDVTAALAEHLLINDAAATYVPKTGAVSMSGTYTVAGSLVMPVNKPWQVQDGAGSTGRFLLFNGNNDFFFGDVDNVFAGSRTVIRGNEAVAFGINGTEMVAVDSSGVHLNPAAVPATSDDSMHVPTTGWVRDVLALIAGSSGTNTINVGSFKIKFGLMTTGNSAVMTHNNGSGDITYGLAYTLPEAFPTAVDSALGMVISSTGESNGSWWSSPVGTSTASVIKIWTTNPGMSVYFIAIGH